MMKNPGTQARHVISRDCVSGFSIIHDVGPPARRAPAPQLKPRKNPRVLVLSVFLCVLLWQPIRVICWDMTPVDLLVVGPHPDDIEIGFAGTVAAHVAQGYRVGLCDL